MSANNSDITLSEVETVAPPDTQPLQAPYAHRQITLTFMFGQGSSQTTLTISGLRVVAHIDKVVWPTMGSYAWLKVYGMTLDHMNQISVAGLLYSVGYNSVLVQAGDDQLGLTTVFKGLIQEAYPSLDTAEDSHFYVYASYDPLAQLQPVSPTSFPGAGGVQASTIIQNLASQAGYGFQNYGVTATLASPYYWGTIWQQIYAAVKAADCYAYLDDASNELVIWPKIGASSLPESSAVISPQTGMIGYPKFQKNYIIVRTLFNPQIQVNRPGFTVTVMSQLAAANNAQLNITQVYYDLASELPDGPWEVTVAGVPINVSAS